MSVRFLDVDGRIILEGVLEGFSEPPPRLWGVGPALGYRSYRRVARLARCAVYRAAG